MTRHAVAYIRRSSGTESPASREHQAEAIASQSAARGDTVTETFTDWGLSGGDGSRPEFLRMMAAVEAGSVSAVYTYDADRLARSTGILGTFLSVAADAGTAVIDRQGRDWRDAIASLARSWLPSMPRHCGG